MLNYIKAEIIKSKRTFSKKAIIIIPLITYILSLILMGGQGGKEKIMFFFNIWYILLGPFLLTWISASTINNEKKYCYHGLLAIVQDKEYIWYGKLISSLLFVGISHIFLFVVALFMKISSNAEISIGSLLVACIVLFISFAWQVPFSMIIAEKLNIYISIIASIIGNLIIGVGICATEVYWWFPYGIPSRLMCPIIKTLPNGMDVVNNPSLDDSSVILPGIIISVVLFVIVSYMSGKIFKKKEI